MALSERLKEEILALSDEQKAEVRRLLDEPQKVHPNPEMQAWIERATAFRKALATRGFEIDAVAEIRDIRDNGW
ncbi:hypothetical protein EON79_10115 [bacterium]|nr:MAG: hypothetical protein EON79_10115 [bacterium]